MSTRVELQGLSYAYPRTDDGPAVAGVDLVVAPGELVALLGPSGCGKTTLLRLVAGLLRPATGDVLLDDASVVDVPPEARSAAMVFQQPLLFPHMTVAENVGFGLRMRGVGRTELRDRVEEHLALVQLAGLGDRRVDELSGGQAQRVSLARALVLQPRLLLLDEPFSALDANLRVEMRSLVRELQAELQVTALFVTHDQEEAVVLADRIALVLHGTVQQVGPPEDFYRRPASRAVARFFGTHNIVEGELEGDVFRCPLGRLRVTAAAPFTGPATLLARQEAVVVGPGPNQLEARVTRTLYAGTHLRVWLDVDGVELQATARPTDRVEVGTRRTVHLAPEHAWVVPR